MEVKNVVTLQCLVLWFAYLFSAAANNETLIHVIVRCMGSVEGFKARIITCNHCITQANDSAYVFLGFPKMSSQLAGSA